MDRADGGEPRVARAGAAPSERTTPFVGSELYGEAVKDYANGGTSFGGCSGGVKILVSGWGTAGTQLSPADSGVVIVTGA